MTTSTPWRYIGFRGTKYVRKTPTRKATMLAGWCRANYRLRSRAPVEIMPSAAHDKRSPRSVHREGRALDIYPADDAEGWRLAHTLAAYPDGGDIDGIIWKDYAWGFGVGPFWHYTGRRDHDTHLHVEVRPE